MTDSLQDSLQDQPQKYDFFQAVRLLELLAVGETDRPGPSGPLGSDHAPADESIRFRALPSLSFSTGQIDAYQPRQPGKQDRAPDSPAELVVNFMGLFGPHGALPQHYTTLIISRLREKDPALRDFLDLFNHRAISLFYRAWRKNHFPAEHEYASRTNQGEDAFTVALWSLVGLGGTSLRDRQQIPDQVRLHFSGLLGSQHRSALSLQRMLTEYFQIPMVIEQFQGQWLLLDQGNQSSLSYSEIDQDPCNQCLGQSVTLGEKVWDVQSKFRIRVGPVNYGQFTRFTPTGDALGPLTDLARTFAGPQFDMDVQVVLAAGEAPACCLTSDPENAAHLGWNSWLHSGKIDHDLTDAVFTPVEV